MAFLSGLDKDKKTVLYIGIAVLGLAIIIRVFAQKPSTTASPTDATSGAANATWLASFLATWNATTGATNTPGSAPAPTPAPTATSAPPGAPVGVPYSVAGAAMPTTGAAPVPVTASTRTQIVAQPTYTGGYVQPQPIPMSSSSTAQTARAVSGGATSLVSNALRLLTAPVRSFSVPLGVQRYQTAQVIANTPSAPAPAARFIPPGFARSYGRGQGDYGYGEGDDGSGGGEYGEGQGDYYGYGHRGGYGYGEGDDSGAGGGEYGEGQGEYYGYGQMDAYGYGQGDDAIGAAMNIADFQSYSGYGRYGDASQLGTGHR